VLRKILSVRILLPKFGIPLPKFGRARLKFGRPLPKFGRARLKFGRPLPKFGRPLPKFGRARLKFGRLLSKFRISLLNIRITLRLSGLNSSWLWLSRLFFCLLSYMLRGLIRIRCISIPTFPPVTQNNEDNCKMI